MQQLLNYKSQPRLQPSTPGIRCSATASRLDATTDMKTPPGSQSEPFAGLLFPLQRAAKFLMHIVAF